MKPEDKLKEKLGTDAGFKVPEGYFDEIYVKISASLPERKPLEPVKLSNWQRLKPYIYLAAMFAGIWCTLKMVSMMSDRSADVITPVSLDNPPALVAQAMSTPGVADMAVPAATATTIEIAVQEDAGISAAEDVETTESEDLVEPVLTPDYYYDVDLDRLRAELDAPDADEDSMYGQMF